MYVTSHSPFSTNFCFQTFRTLVTWLGSQVDDMIWSRISLRLLTDTSNGIAHSESLLILVLLAAKDGEMLQVRFSGIMIGVHRIFCKIIRQGDYIQL